MTIRTSLIVSLAAAAALVLEVLFFSLFVFASFCAPESEWMGTAAFAVVWILGVTLSVIVLAPLSAVIGRFAGKQKLAIHIFLASLFVATVFIGTLMFASVPETAHPAELKPCEAPLEAGS
ncbi:MAG: hypothetical protein DWQ47_06335 [Acidobacteria bacterium]|nr:MAG: hypothetical protein DWQ32_09885 [Acidobacteriota bacterium]REK01992.1 MAG: hypothetical protein DWQ38_06320 [Acidobacteriota bacterium]REK14949.1 MAG: hypothetical protein DWQ43_15575 [Acidobacteriota bacterium]REK45663.1 MAG: hypothetical protein DWQ47_06335 [Acidobacteriota bacterium]